MRKVAQCRDVGHETIISVYLEYACRCLVCSHDVAVLYVAHNVGMHVLVYHEVVHSVPVCMLFAVTLRIYFYFRWLCAYNGW